MDEKECQLLLISDFNTNNLAGYARNDNEDPIVDAIIAPFGQVVPVLMQEDLECWQSNPDVAVVWTQPENVSESFNHVVNFKHEPIEKILAEVDEYCSLLLNIRDRARTIFVPTWVFPSYHRGLGMLDMRIDIGISNTLMRMNLRLSEKLSKASNFYLLDAQRWISIAGRKAFDPRLWYLGKIPFGNDVFIEAVKDIKSALRGVAGNSKKIVILDLDDTLWGGVVGEVGWENVRLGGHDHIGEAFVDFQSALKFLRNKGVLLGIVSKNEEAIALEAINKHPEMLLRLEDFAAWKINWQDKAKNIVELVLELNIGLQSVVFIDNSPVERERVREALPEVFVPDWPEDIMLYRSTLVNLNCFDTPSISKEDFERTEIYISERQRKKLKESVGSLDEWLKSLKMTIKVEQLSESNLQRVTQLLNKTNQMNLSTRRMTETELVNWVKQENHLFWIFRVMDKFGDSGITGLVSLEVESKIGKIVDFVLSCRVMGRKVEETMLYKIVQYAQERHLDEVWAIYKPTPKNKPCLELLKSSGFKNHLKNNRFVCDVTQDYPLFKYIKLME